MACVDGRRSTPRARRAARVSRAASSTSFVRSPQRRSPASRTRPSIPTTAQLEGPLAEAVGERLGRRNSSRVETSGATPVLVGADGDRRRVTVTWRPASCTSVPRSMTRGGCASTARTSRARLGFGVTTAYDVAAPGAADAGLREPVVADVVARAAGRPVAAGAGRRQPAVGARAVAHRPGARRDADRPRCRARRRPAAVERSDRLRRHRRDSTRSWSIDRCPSRRDRAIEVRRRDPAAAPHPCRLTVVGLGALGHRRPGQRRAGRGHVRDRPRTVDARGVAGRWLTSTWFCPGVPAGGEDGVAGASSSPTTARRR